MYIYIYICIYIYIYPLLLLFLLFMYILCRPRQVEGCNDAIVTGHRKVVGQLSLAKWV